MRPSDRDTTTMPLNTACSEIGSAAKVELDFRSFDNPTNR